MYAILTSSSQNNVG